MQNLLKINNFNISIIAQIQDIIESSHGCVMMRM